MLLNNTGFSTHNNLARINDANSSKVIKTDTQTPFDLHKTKLFIEMLE